MDVVLQRHCAKYIYVVPDGLRELMSDISREVIRSQPHNINTFIADYLDALMITRENARIAAKLVQNLTETTEVIMEFLQKTGMMRQEADTVTAFINDAIHEYFENLKRRELYGPEETETEAVQRIISQLGISEEEAERATEIIQNAFRNYRVRKEKQHMLLSGYVDWRVAARSAIKFYRKTGVSNEEAARAATLIKAAYKGYYTRRVINRLKAETLSTTQEDEEEEGEEDGMEEEGSEGGILPKKRKSVQLNFDSILPHVDFDVQSHVIDESQMEATNVARSVMEEVFDRAVSGQHVPEIAVTRVSRKLIEIPKGAVKEENAMPEDGLVAEQTSEEFIKQLLMDRVMRSTSSLP